MLFDRQGGAPHEWPLRLVDKRATYVRTHRLRLAPEPFSAVQRDLCDPRFDAFVEFLRAEDHRPEVNVLEERLGALVSALGIERHVVTVGERPGERTLADLRHMLEDEGALAPEGRFTIVGADSVHSTVREMVRGDSAPARHVHQRVARLRVVGADLPDRLGSVQQVRLSKVLGSILDYRRNANGFAEVDLFLSQSEHDAVRDVDATPKSPAELTPGKISSLRAPLFARIVEHLRGGFGGGASDVLLQSTFELEHIVMPRLVFERPELRADVFLVGDAAVSLPFFRGMACLTQCVRSLAHVHCDLVAAARRDRAPAATRDSHARRTAILHRYDVEAASIKGREMAVVRARGRLVRVVREIVRVSALVPFPLQTWLLSAKEIDPRPDGPSRAFLLNAALALAAAALGLGGPALATLGHPEGAWLVPIALVVQALGGVAYQAVHTLDRGPHRWVRAAWRAQTVVLFLVGAPLAVFAYRRAGIALGLLAATTWLVLAAMFVVGLYLYERVVARWFDRAEL